MPENKDRLSQSKEKASAFFLANIGLVRKIAFEKAPGYDLSQDIVNDVFINFVENADRWDFSRDLRPLLSKITRDVANLHWRHFLKNCPAKLGEIYGYLRENSKEQNSEETFRTLEQEVGALNVCRQKLLKKYRLLLDAYYAGGLTLNELSEKEKIKLGTLQKLMSRIRGSLRKCIENILRVEVFDVE